MMQILLLNAGSSSLKYQLIQMSPTPHKLAAGLAERIGESESYWTHNATDDALASFQQQVAQFPNHDQALDIIINQLNVDESQLSAIGHRVVHGGPYYKQATYIDNTVLRTIRELIPLAPLHNLANAMAIEVARKRYPDIAHYAIFDNAYHHTMPDYAAHYAIDQTLCQQHKIRRYGFHGTSHAYVSKVAANGLGIAYEHFHAITLHLGNGASACAIRNGCSIDTSMGFTPLAGLIMGTRCGDIDPSIAVYLQRECHMSADEIDQFFNKRGGMNGIAGDNDMRNIENRHRDGDTKATLALEMYIYRIKQTVGSYYATLGQLDALIFTAGVGENSAIVRQMACHNMQHLGFELDEDKNHHVDKNQVVTDISSANSQYRILVVPTNEELQMALEIQQQLLKS